MGSSIIMIYNGIVQFSPQNVICNSKWSPLNHFNIIWKFYGLLITQKILEMANPSSRNFVKLRKVCWQILQLGLYYMVTIHSFYNIFVAFEWNTLWKSNMRQTLSHPILQPLPNNVFVFCHALPTGSPLWQWVV
jgi:hypothetical protein